MVGGTWGENAGKDLGVGMGVALGAEGLHLAMELEFA